MLKKNIFQLILVLALLLTMGWLFWASNQSAVTIKGQSFELEIADDDAERALGLGERDSLCATCAMLFVFPEAGRHSFWMKGMRFSLDILWLSQDGKITHIEKNVPADSKETFSPSEQANQVLELNGGWADRLGLEEGDQVYFSK